MIAPVESVEIERPWAGPCATTGLTMDDMAELLDTVPNAPAWVKRAAVSIFRSYSRTIGGPRRLPELAAVIDRWRAAEAIRLTHDMLVGYANAERTFFPQYPETHERWMLLAAVDVADRYTIRGVSDVPYIANVIAGELHRTNQRRAR